MESVEYTVYIIIILAIYRLLSTQIRGIIGELIVRIRLSRLPKDKFKVLNNVLLKTKRGTTQIDHIVVSVYGIFVIETKNYKGLIIGNGKSNEWTKRVYKKEYQFRNPIIQNKGHIRALSNILNEPEDLFTAIVVFLNNCKLRIKTQNIVIKIDRLVPIIQRKNNIKLTTKQIENIVNKINNAKQKGIIKQLKHIAYVKKRQNKSRN